MAKPGEVTIMTYAGSHTDRDIGRRKHPTVFMEKCRKKRSMRGKTDRDTGEGYPSVREKVSLTSLSGPSGARPP